MYGVFSETFVVREFFTYTVRSLNEKILLIPGVFARAQTICLGSVHCTTTSVVFDNLDTMDSIN